MRQEVLNLKKPQKVAAHLAELKQIKRRVYDAVSQCTQLLVEGAEGDQESPKADDDLFELEFGPLSEMSRFLSWEIMHL